MEIVNVKRRSADVYCGRGSKWGNPFVIGRDGNREDVIRKYKEWVELWREEKREIVLSVGNAVYSNKVVDDVEELRGKVCGCFCKPLSCHLDVLKEILG
jgi:hypothetical protein